METDILADVSTYLGDEVSEQDNPVLLILINRAIRKICSKRYPYGYTDKQKAAAVSKYRDMVFDAAVYYWAKQGSEGQSSHSENGISRGYQSEDDLYFDVVPMAKTLL
ncbi:hypothetical protein BXY41_11611 [Lacrimispora xylanisolvens]|uniref:Gp6-like head-tail connector protein n=1 Tax=Lacrimispora xylanisolvens TaxID=384636 RepID=A0A2S6HJA4_9FIRM|nr:hypothetical protein [Hungatella xylanolytica]PPK77473.1 hypothetical protein BXY41_11611 [Hungatella xylanolytica]